MKKLTLLGTCVLLLASSSVLAYTSVLPESTGTGSVSTGTIIVGTGTIIANTEVTTPSRLIGLESAHTRAFFNHITSIESLNRFRPDNLITREQAAKMMVQFARVTLGDDYFQRADKQAFCDFSDKNNISTELRSYVIESCHFGIFKWSNSAFNPKWNLTKFQAGVLLQRISWVSVATGSNTPITRGEVVIQMFDLVH
jgi:hypothetical protein